MADNAIQDFTANIEGVEQAVNALLGKDIKFTALVAYNDLMFIGTHLV